MALEKPSSTPSLLNAKNPFTKLTNQDNYPDRQDSCPVITGSSGSPFCPLVITDKNDYYILKSTFTQSENWDLYTITFQALNKTIGLAIILGNFDISKKENDPLRWQQLNAQLMFFNVFFGIFSKFNFFSIIRTIITNCS